MKLIDKDAVLVEIEKLHNQHISPNYVDEAGLVLEQLEDNICSLEVKEVDFDAEWERYFEHRGEMATVNVKHLAKYFFELGMSVSNKAQNIWHDTKEKPKEGSRIAFWDGMRMMGMDYADCRHLNSWLKHSDKWAYVDELLNL